MESVNLSAANNWRYTWEDLPTQDEEGNPVSYTIEEAVVAGYTPEYEYITNADLKGYWVPAESMKLGHRYIIVSPDTKHVLYVSDGKADDPFTSNEQKSVTAASIQLNGKTVNAISADQIDMHSVFMPEAVDNQNNKRTLLKNLGITSGSWLLAQEAGNNYLKGANNPDYASGVRYEDNSILIQREWYADSEWRTLIYSGNKFTTATSPNNNQAKLYEFAYTSIGSDTVVRITNRRVEDQKFTLDLTKRSGINTNVLLAGAEFQLLQNGRALSFKMDAPGAYTLVTGATQNATQTLVTNSDGKLVLKGLSMGEYLLRETKAPAEHRPIADMIVNLGQPDDKGHVSLTLPLTIIDEPYAYALPETGGTGTQMYTTAGLLLMLTSAAFLMYKFRKRRKEAI